MLSGAGERTMGGGYHGGLLSIDMFAQVSNLRAVNPLIKFIFAISVLLATLWADSPLTSIVVVVMITIALVPVARIPMGYLFVLMKMPLLFIVISCITIAVNFTTQPFGFANLAFAGGYLSITAFSLQKAAALALKAYAAVSCLYFLSLTTPMPEIVDILRKLHIPAIVIELMYLIYRYIFVLFSVQQRMTVAAQSRLGYGTLRTSFYSFSHIGGNLLASSFRRSSQCFCAMESRGYDGKLAFLTEDSPCNKKHLVLFCGLFCCFLMLICLIKMKGWGLF